MKILFKVLLLLTLCTFSYSSDISNVTIEKVMIDKAHGEKLFVQISQEPSDAPDCSTNESWQYVFNLESEFDRNTFVSFLLSAYVAKSPVRIIGTGGCTPEVYSSIETLRRVELM